MSTADASALIPLQGTTLLHWILSKHPVLLPRGWCDTRASPVNLGLHEVILRPAMVDISSSFLRSGSMARLSIL